MRVDLKRDAGVRVAELARDQTTLTMMRAASVTTVNPRTPAAGNGNTPKTATADCPGTKKALGGGSRVVASGEVAEMTTYESFPSDDNTWTVSAAEDHPAGSVTWSAGVCPLCRSALAVSHVR